jgi:hypothetical protein
MTFPRIVTVCTDWMSSLEKMCLNESGKIGLENIKCNNHDIKSVELLST